MARPNYLEKYIVYHSRETREGQAGAPRNVSTQLRQAAVQEAPCVCVEGAPVCLAERVVQAETSCVYRRREGCGSQTSRERRAQRVCVRGV